MTPASASKHKQDEVKCQNQHHFTAVLDLAEDWDQITQMKRPSTSQWGYSIANRQVTLPLLSTIEKNNLETVNAARFFD